jgi:hypothetical protein
MFIDCSPPTSQPHLGAACFLSHMTLLMELGIMFAASINMLVPTALCRRSHTRLSSNPVKEGANEIGNNEGSTITRRHAP